MIVFENSIEYIEKPILDNHDIVLISQFFIHNNNERNNEIKKCLRLNATNQYINKIYLLNEKIYDNTELGIDNKKIVQVNINKRLEYKDVFKFVEEERINGYIVFCNSDIFINESIKKLHKSILDKEKIFIALLRYEYKKSLAGNKHIGTIFGPRPDSQDTWIFHSNFNLDKNQMDILNFNFGMPGCDNKITYLMKIFGYKLLNCPNIIKSFHIHTSEIRDYTSKDLIPTPYIWLNQLHFKTLDSNIEKFKKVYFESNKFEKYTFNDNDTLSKYISSKFENKTNFIIPRIAGVENNIALIGNKLKNKQLKIDNIKDNILGVLRTMKNNAGIFLENNIDIIEYSDLYFDAFNNSDLFSEWEKHGDVYKYISQSHDYITNIYPKNNIWAFTFDIFHYIHSNPWTLSLRGKKILIISSFVDSFKEKEDIRENIYGIDLFPECEFVYLKPPQTNGTNKSRNFLLELQDFIQSVKETKMETNFDVALVSCGGYGNLICNEIFKMGSSSIYIGGVLQMYFGVYGSRWLRERKDVLKLYLNEYWSRPKEHEKPVNYKNIEGSCYW